MSVLIFVGSIFWSLVDIACFGSEQMWLLWNPTIPVTCGGWEVPDGYSVGWHESQVTGDGLEGKAKMDHKEELEGRCVQTQSVSDRM